MSDKKILQNDTSIQEKGEPERDHNLDEAKRILLRAQSRLVFLKKAFVEFSVAAEPVEIDNPDGLTLPFWEGLGMICEDISGQVSTSLGLINAYERGSDRAPRNDVWCIP